MICITEIRTSRFGSLLGVSHIVSGTSYRGSECWGIILVFYFTSWYSEIEPSSCLPSFQFSMSGKSCRSMTHGCRRTCACSRDGTCSRDKARTCACSRDGEDKARNNGSPGAV